MKPSVKSVVKSPWVRQVAADIFGTLILAALFAFWLIYL